MVIITDGVSGVVLGVVQLPGASFTVAFPLRPGSLARWAVQSGRTLSSRVFDSGALVLVLGTLVFRQASQSGMEGGSSFASGASGAPESKTLYMGDLEPWMDDAFLWNVFSEFRPMVPYTAS